MAFAHLSVVPLCEDALKGSRKDTKHFRESPIFGSTHLLFPIVGCLFTVLGHAFRLFGFVGCVHLSSFLVGAATRHSLFAAIPRFGKGGYQPESSRAFKKFLFRCESVVPYFQEFHFRRVCIHGNVSFFGHLFLLDSYGLLSASRPVLSYPPS